MARLIDADAFDKVLEDAQMQCKKNGGNFRFGVLSTVRANLKNAPTVGGWVSVKDRMPDKIDCYLVALKNHGGIDLDVYHPDINAFNHHRQYVEYWMQIPNLPEVKDEV